MVSTENMVAAARGAGVLAVNVITLEHAQGIVVGAEKADRPVILQLSENAIRYHGGAEAIAAAMRAVAERAAVPVALHLDHITDERLAGRTRELGFHSVMFDASTASYEENVVRTRAVVERARAHGVWVEAELGEIGGKGGPHDPGVRTDPAEARAFVEATGVDALAVAVGSQHAMTRRSAALDVDLIRRLAEDVPVPLVLHGSSGVPASSLRDAIAAGMVKINIGTAMNIAFTRAVREHLASDAEAVDPRGYLRAGRDAVAQQTFSQFREIIG